MVKAYIQTVLCRGLLVCVLVALLKLKLHQWYNLSEIKFLKFILHLLRILCFTCELLFL